jgi:hypothetical protein
MSKRNSRLAKEKAAADFLEKHHGPLAELVVDVTSELGDEIADLPQFQRDARIAAQMAYRLDKAIKIPNELAEALDFFGFYIASLLAIGIYRLVEKKTEKRQRRADVLKRKLRERGPKMAAARKRSIERRIEKLLAS